MSTKLKAGTATSGAVIDADTTGILELQSGSTPTTAITIDASQNVGIGTSSPSVNGKLTLSASGSSNYQTIIAGSNTSLVGTDANGLALSALGANNIVCYTVGAERMRIGSDGRLFVNGTGAASYFDGKINSYGESSVPALCLKNDGGGGQFTASFWCTATSGNNIFANFVTETSPISRGGITYNRGANQVAYNTTSDERLKENIVDAPSALNKVDSIKIRSFDWKETGIHNEFGVIAQELNQVAPEAVTKGIDNEDGSIKQAWCVDTSALIPALIKAVQELKAEVDALKGAK